MFSGGDYDEVARWLRNFVTAHAKRENLRAEAVVETEGEREGSSYGVRLRLGEALHPPIGEPPMELAFDEVERNRGQLAWCSALAERIRALARKPSPATTGHRRAP
ncbi:MAG TPA: hypothetical protein VMS64_40920 [Candidatus Methylomirabilis sp.]|nr:hypothetical protein [Candidatus Methylomirabilis sp.]